MAINPWIVDGSEGWDVPQTTERAEPMGPTGANVFEGWREAIRSTITAGGMGVDERRRAFDAIMDGIVDDDDENDEFPENFDDPQDDDEVYEVSPEAQFIRNNGEYCPVCGSEEFVPIIHRDRTNKAIIVLNVKCEECESTWNSYFKLYKIDNIDDATGMDDDALKRLGL